MRDTISEESSSKMKLFSKKISQARKTIHDGKYEMTSNNVCFIRSHSDPLSGGDLPVYAVRKIDSFEEYGCSKDHEKDTAFEN